MNKFVFDPTRKFLDPERVLFSAGLASGQTFADFGSGSGFYSLAASKIVGDQGAVYSVDILESALDHVVAEARLKGLRNIKTLMCNLEQPNSCAQVSTGTVDMVLLANITHQIKDRSILLGEAFRLLKTGGKLVVIEWNDQPSPIGPVAGERVSEPEITSSAKKSGFKGAGDLNVDPYHYGLIFLK
jgi:ubiquinone/menaquinone biosynthesis C-methylase UbiE